MGLVGVSLRSILLLHLTEEDFFYFFRMMKKTNTREEKDFKKRGKKISQKSRVKKGGTPKTDTKKTTDDLLERDQKNFGSIDRSIDRLLPPPSTEYTAIDKKPKLGDLFFLTRRVFLRENARGVRVERAYRRVVVSFLEMMRLEEEEEEVEVERMVSCVVAIPDGAASTPRKVFFSNTTHQRGGVEPRVVPRRLRR